MSEVSSRQQGLANVLETLGQPENATAKIVGVRDRGYLNLRGSVDDAGFVTAAERILEQPLPHRANTISSSETERRICWLGPDEWLIVGTASDCDVLCKKLESGLKSFHTAVNMLSGGFVTVRLIGAKSAHILAKGCTLDFHRDAFPVASCAQSGLAKAAVLLVRNGEDAFDIIVRRSFADYLLTWLLRAASA